MPVGRTTARHLPFVAVEVAGQPLAALIDTGFDGGMQLPDSFRVLLNPPELRIEPFMYPNGDIDNLPVYLVRVLIDGEAYDADTIFGPPDEVLLGAGLLRFFRLMIDFPAGTVVLEKPA